MLYNYKAYDNDKLILGKVEANSKNDVVNYLKNNNLFPVTIREQTSQAESYIAGIFSRVSFNDIVDFTRQLAIMLNAGLTLIDSFDILKKQTTKPALSKVLIEIDKEIRGGQPFSSALQKYHNLFPNLYISLVKSGEASGKLSEILLKLAENLEKEREFKGKIKGALIYPIIIIIGMVSVMFIMVTFVLPKLLSLYHDFNVELPVTTQILITVSSFSARFWPLIIGAVVGIVVLVQSYLKTKPGKLMYDSFMLKLPILGHVVTMSTLVDSTRTLSILIGSGVSILDSLNIIIDTTDNIIYQNAFKEIYRNVEKGTSLGTAMSNQGVFPPILIQMTTVGEQTGHLYDTLMRISTYFEMESEIAIKTLTTLIEPAILVVLGLGVGFLVMSVITPIYNLTSSFK